METPDRVWSGPAAHEKAIRYFHDSATALIASFEEFGPVGWATKQLGRIFPSFGKGRDGQRAAEAGHASRRSRRREDIAVDVHIGGIKGSAPDAEMKMFFLAAGPAGDDFGLADDIAHRHDTSDELIDR